MRGANRAVNPLVACVVLAASAAGQQQGGAIGARLEGIKVAVSGNSTLRR
jgi:hypothetical protein